MNGTDRRSTEPGSSDPRCKVDIHLQQGQTHGVVCRESSAGIVEPPLWSGLEVLITLLLYQLLAVSLALLGAVLVPVDDPRYLYLQPCFLLLAAVGTIGYVVLQVRRVLGQPWATLGLRRASWSNLAPCVALHVLLFAPMSTCALVWQAWLEGIFGFVVAQQAPVEQFIDAVKRGDGLGIGGMVVTAVIVAPVVEELIFRGFFYGLLRRRWGLVPATFFSSLVFGLYHLNVLAALPLTLVGVALAIVYERTGSLWWAIFWHALFNGSSLLLMLVAAS